MAFVQDQLDENGNPIVPGQGAQVAVPGGGGTNAVNPQAQSSSGAQAGGGGGWTNIQAYLKANEGGSGSAQALNSAAQSQFGQEREKMTGDANKFTADAENEVKNKSIDNNQADDLIKQSGQQYSWGGQQADPYMANVKKAQNFLNTGYQGPRDYTYGFSADTQKYGEGVKDNQAFDSLMGQVYNKGAGRPLSSGQFQLQKQFDVNNEALANARQNLGTQYDQLGKDRDQLVTGTTDKLKGLESTYQNNQARFRDYLGLKQNELDTNIAKAENAARSGYQSSYDNDSSGERWLDNDVTKYAADAGMQNIFGREYTKQYLGNQDINSKNGLNWRDMQEMLNRPTLISDDGFRNLLGSGNNYYGNNYDRYQGDAHLATIKDIERRYRDEMGGKLNNFYGQQTEKYKDTGDTEKRGYNAILDFLGQTNGKKSQGFNVRG